MTDPKPETILEAIERLERHITEYKEQITQLQELNSQLKSMAEWKPAVIRALKDLIGLLEKR